FWKLVADIFLFVGHNILDFDLRFIYQRSVINRIKPSRGIPFARYRSAPVFDTMHEWTKWGRDSVGLDALAKALGLESPKANLDGSHVYDYHRVGRHPEIYEYCCRDVETVRRIYRRMTFTE
ncbi:MAG: ribonuclease H-like domain-containing protein, partial [Deltaproteobacteria bacterium]|nr:ribonuclease H-like domain-containing protein [Deltaproteobacteria bacterium]